MDFENLFNTFALMFIRNKNSESWTGLLTDLNKPNNKSSMKKRNKNKEKDGETD